MKRILRQSAKMAREKNKIKYIDTSEDEAEAVSVSVSSVKRRNDKEHDANEGSKCGNSLPTLSSSSRPLKEVEVITLSDECNENEGGKRLKGEEAKRKNKKNQQPPLETIRVHKYGRPRTIPYIAPELLAKSPKDCSKEENRIRNNFFYLRSKQKRRENEEIRKQEATYSRKYNHDHKEERTAYKRVNAKKNYPKNRDKEKVRKKKMRVIRGPIINAERVQHFLNGGVDPKIYGKTKRKVKHVYLLLLIPLSGTISTFQDFQSSIKYVGESKHVLRAFRHFSDSLSESTDKNDKLIKMRNWLDDDRKFVVIQGRYTYYEEAIRHEYALTCYLGLQNLLNSVKGHYHEWHPSMEKEATEILNKLWEENKMRINVLKKVGKKEIEELSETKNQGWRKSYRQDDYGFIREIVQDDDDKEIEGDELEDDERMKDVEESEDEEWNSSYEEMECGDYQFHCQDEIIDSHGKEYEKVSFEDEDEVGLLGDQALNNEENGRALPILEMSSTSNIGYYPIHTYEKTIVKNTEELNKVRKEADRLQKRGDYLHRSLIKSINEELNWKARSESLEIKLEVINDERCSSKKMSEKVDRIEAVNKKDIGVQCNPPLVLRLAVDPLSKTFNIVK